jgi:hypothetical protein
MLVAVAVEYLIVVALLRLPVLAVWGVAVMEELRLHRRGQLVPGGRVPLIQVVVVVGWLTMLQHQIIKDMAAQVVQA